MNTGVISRVPASSPCGCGCGCTDSACECCDPVGLERTRFFPRMLVGPEELTQDQTWIRDRLRRHNRLLHGWGVVCGCDVTQQTDANGDPVPWTVCVSSGDVLGPCGDDIVVDCPTTFDVRGGLAGELGPCTPPADPWCADVRVERRPRQTYYLAIRYDEQLVRPVRSLAGCGCGCDEAECEYSRIRESFALGVLDALPTSYRPAGNPWKIAGPHAAASSAAAAAAAIGGLQGALICSPAFRAGVRPCPPCPDDPWVILADFTVDDRGLLVLDPVAHRRYVVSFAAYAFMCGATLREQQQPQRMRMTPQLRRFLGSRLDARARTTVERANDPGTAVGLAATSLTGVGPRSKLGRLLGARTIGELAGADRGAFVREARENNVDVAAAGKLWDAASEVAGRVTP